MLRASYNWMAEKLNEIPSYKMFYVIPDSVREELAFWKSEVRVLSGYPISPSQSLTETRLTIVTDASEDGALRACCRERCRSGAWPWASLTARAKTVETMTSGMIEGNCHFY